VFTGFRLSRFALGRNDGEGEVIGMNRRTFVTLVPGALAWPLAAGAQQGERIRRIGILQGFAENDPEWQRRFAALKEGLQERGWSEGTNLQIDYRCSDIE